MRRRICTWICRAAALCGFAALVMLNYSDSMRVVRNLPETIYVSEAERLPEILSSDGASAVRVDRQQAERMSDVADTLYTFRLLGLVPLKTVQVVRAGETLLVPGGNAVGITLHTAGVLVVGLGSVETEDGAQSPASAAGLAGGDVIVSVDGIAVCSAAHFSELCSDCNGSMRLLVERGEERRALTIYPVRDRENGCYRIGAWVRDSTAGVGTLSFYSQQEGAFAALGHPVSDIDTQSTLTVRDGKLLSAEIVDVIRGEQGEPGELLGVFSPDGRPIGTIEKNTDFGIFGKLDNTEILSSIQGIPMAYAYEAHTGKATLLATVCGSTVEAYECEISRVNTQQSPSAKGMIVTVTDERLLSVTGGIVQGMSGSPILQDGKLIGVVTHVFVNDPTKGYCIYAEWMVQQMR